MPVAPRPALRRQKLQLHTPRHGGQIHVEFCRVSLASSPYRLRRQGPQNYKIQPTKSTACENVAVHLIQREDNSNTQLDYSFHTKNCYRAQTRL